MSSRNNDLQRYFEIQREIEALEAEKDELRQKLILIGNHSTADFLCTVTLQERRQLPGIGTLEKIEDIWTQIEPFITVKEVKMLKVQPKGKVV
jgi:hypothetical protein